MVRLAFISSIVALVIGVISASPQPGMAKDGGLLAISPNVGEVGITVELGTEYWVPSGRVDIYAGFVQQLYTEGVSREVAEPEQFFGPIATTTSQDAGPHSGDNGPTGYWSVRIPIDTAQLHLPQPLKPGYIIFKAVTEGRVTEGTGQQIGKEEETNFALAVDGVKPDGAGAIHLSVAVASGIDDEAFLYDIQPAGSSFTTFEWYPAGAMYANNAKPFQTTDERLENGDYYVFVQPIGRRQVIGPGTFESVAAELCFAPPMGCNTPGTFIVKRVRVSGGNTSHVTIQLGGSEEAAALTVLPSAGGGPSSTPIVPDSPVLYLIAAGGAALALAIAVRMFARTRETSGRV